MAETDILTQAMAAARRGERRRARQMLTKVLKADSKNEEAWLWMSAVVESDRERVFCLQSVLKLNPDNKAAETGLMLLGAVPAKEQPRSILGDYEHEPTAEAGPRGSRRLTFLRRRRTYEWAAITGLSAALLCCVGLAWGINAARGGFAALNAARTTEAYISPTPTPAPSETRTPPPSATPSVRTATPTLDPATPLAFVVGADVRPTAVYFETPHGENDAYQAGLRRYHSGDWAELIRFMETALDSNPRLFEAHFYIGEAYRQTARPADALRAYDAALELNAGFAPAYWGRGLAQAGLGRVSQALADLELAKESDPAWPAPYIERANLLRDRGDLEAARDELVSASTIIPNDAAVRWNLARVLADLGQTEAALREVEAAHSADPAIVEIYQVRGRLLLAQGQYHEARADLGLYLTYRPGDAEGWYYRAAADVALDDEPAALADFDRALALDPDYYDALVARGEYYLRLERYDEALEDFAAALAQADTAQVRLGRGQAYYHQGDLGQAALDFRRAVNREPESYPANYWLGRALVEAEQPADALPPLETALEAAEDDDARLAAYQARADAYRQLGRLEEEAADLRSLLELEAKAEGPQQTAAAQLKQVQAAQTATVVAASATVTPSPTLSPTPSPTRSPEPTRTPTVSRTP